MEKMRLDVLISKKQLVESRRKAWDLIKTGKVLVDGKRILKPATPVSPNAKIEIESFLPYVGRGGLKLKAALDEFNLDVKGLVVADVGSSTGGFTDCLLQEGAGRVYAIDVGKDQLHPKLRRDPRVVVYEGVDIRELKSLAELVDLVTIDVSYISLTLVLPYVQRLLKPRSQIIALIKPQFEVGPRKRHRTGVVKDESLREEAIKRIKKWAAANGWIVRELIESPIVGYKAGNIEYLIYFSR